MSQERVDEEWDSLSSLPPKEAIVAVVLNDMVRLLISKSRILNEERN